MENVISFDWISWNVHLYPIHLSNSFNWYLEGYKIEDMEIGTKIFEKRKIIYKDKMKIATLTYQPKSKIIHPLIGQIQLSNEILYVGNPTEVYNNIMNGLRFEFKSFSRIDICMDIIRFESGDCQEFINQIVSNQIIRLSKQSGYAPFKGGKSIKFTGISWINKGGITAWKIYNKTQEMKDFDNHKQYIRDKWKFYNWNCQDEVYRVELSLKNFSKINIVDKQNSNYLTKSFEYMYHNITNIYSYFLNSTFKFCFNQKKSNISRNEKYILFNMNNIEIKNYNNNSKIQDPTRTSKIVVSDLFDTIIKTSESELKTCLELYDTLFYYIHKYNLYEYFEKKFNIDLELLDLHKNELEYEKRTNEKFHASSPIT